jgi:signal peptidase I
VLILNYVKKFFFDWVVPVVVAVVIALFINKFLLFKIYIPSESMVPTLKIGDQLFVTKIYNKQKIKRGDVVVFYSEELGELLIKRVIGLPGESVDVKADGAVYINGQKLNEPYVENKSTKTGNFQVPQRSLLFLGDNRANSKDSRYWKEPYISMDQVRGKARVIVFPFKRISFVE